MTQRPALLGLQPACIEPVTHCGIPDDQLPMSLQIAQIQLALQLMQGMPGMSHRDEGHVDDGLPQKSLGADARDDEIGAPLVQHFDSTIEDGLLQLHAHVRERIRKPRQRLGQSIRWKDLVHSQSDFRLQAAGETLGHVFQRGSVLDQLTRSAQQEGSRFGEHDLAPPGLEKHHAQLLLDLVDRVIERRRASMNHFCGLGKSTVIGYRRQHLPLQQRHFRHNTLPLASNLHAQKNPMKARLFFDSIFCGQVKRQRHDHD